MLGVLAIGIDPASSVFMRVAGVLQGRLITFWPQSQHPDAHQSYTDPLVDTAVDGTPFDIQIVATRMHEVFRDNAGASPATLMKLLYEEEAETLRTRADQLANLLEESFAREREAELALDQERRARTAAEEARDTAQEELNSLKRSSFIQPPAKAEPQLSKPVVLLRATVGNKGKYNQRAVLLHMSDGTVRACNWDRGFEARLRYAKMLEGTTVRTDVWGGYSEDAWFNNIYPVTTAIGHAPDDDDIPF